MFHTTSGVDVPMVHNRDTLAEINVHLGKD